MDVKFGERILMGLSMRNDRCKNWEIVDEIVSGGKSLKGDC